MKIFPHILSRVGGVPIGKVESFSFEKYQLVEELLQREVEILRIRAIISDEFHNVIKNIESPYLKSNLINAFRDFKKGRIGYVKAIKNLDTDKTEQLIRAASKHEGLLFVKKDRLQRINKVYEEQQIQSFSELQKLSREDNFLKGILQSSQSLYQRILSFNKKEITQFRKKERQTSRSLAQYIYRAAAKTSPFSYFTTLDLMSLEDGVFQGNNRRKSVSSLQYNNFLLLELKEMFLKKMSLCKNMMLQLNPSLIQTESEFCFIKNVRNVETFQRLEKSEFLELIYNKINTQGEVLNVLVKNIQNIVEAEEDELTEYLMDLVEVGFLEFQWDFYGGEKNWEAKFLMWKLSNKILKENNPWEPFFNQLISKKKEYKSEDSNKRFYLQNSLKHDLEICGFSETKPEIIVFEDVMISREFSINENEVTPIIRSLSDLLYLMEPLMQDEMKTKINFLWRKHFINEHSVPLVKFYESFFQEEFDELSWYDKYIEEKKETWKEVISQVGKMSSDGVLHFSLEDIMEKMPDGLLHNYKYSGLFQFYKEEGKTKAVINGLSPGNGKLFGRFLYMFPEKIVKELQDWNKSDHGVLLVENLDASYYNVNLHPVLTSHGIKMHNSFDKSPKQNQIPLSEIEVVWEVGTEPALYYSENKVTKRLIEIVDLGFENPAARSPMFQLLNGFRANHTTYRIFLDMVNEVFGQESEDGIRFLPRVVIDDHLILQRQAQIMNTSFFPKINKNDSPADFFYQIQKFKNLYNLPRFIFVQPIRDFSDAKNILKQDFYKPQIIDLQAPISVELLKSILQKHQGEIQVEEMLPLPEQLDSEYVREDVVEWKRNF